jgi:hypothetical protein
MRDFASDFIIIKVLKRRGSAKKLSKQFVAGSHSHYFLDIIWRFMFYLPKTCGSGILPRYSEHFEPIRNTALGI